VGFPTMPFSHLHSPSIQRALFLHGGSHIATKVVIRENKADSYDKQQICFYVIA